MDAEQRRHYEKFIKMPVVPAPNRERAPFQ
jgi:hypothetical protein